MKPRMPPMIPNENNTIKLKLLTQPNCLLPEKKKDKNANGMELMLTMATNIFQNLGFHKDFYKILRDCSFAVASVNGFSGEPKMFPL
jgi:hypothetical protein